MISEKKIQELTNVDTVVLPVDTNLEPIDNLSKLIIDSNKSLENEILRLRNRAFVEGEIYEMHLIMLISLRQKLFIILEPGNH